MSKSENASDSSVPSNDINIDYPVNASERLPITQPKVLKCGSLNVCSLKRRILYPEFCDLISEYDIFGISETKLDDFDIVQIPNYDFFTQTRKQKYIRKNGGFGVFIHKTIAQKVTLIEI